MVFLIMMINIAAFLSPKIALGPQFLVRLSPTSWEISL